MMIYDTVLIIRMIGLNTDDDNDDDGDDVVVVVVNKDVKC